MSEQTRRRTTDFALLGIIAQAGPLSGYDMRAYLDQSVAQFWSESFGQIYPALDRMQKLKWIAASSDRSSVRERRLYTITPSGRAALEAWLQQASLIERPRSELLLKVFLGDQVPARVSIEHLQDFLDRARARLAALKHTETDVSERDRGKDSLPYSIITIRAGISAVSARIQWARESIQLLQQHVADRDTSADTRKAK